MKHVKEELTKWRGTVYLWIERLNTVKIQILHKLICTFNTVPVNFQQDSFSTYRQTDSKINLERQKN